MFFDDTSLMLGENLREPPDLVKRVVERGGGDADDVRFAEIALHVGRFQLVEKLLRMLAYQDRELTAARAGLAWCDHGKEFGWRVVQEKLKVSG